MAYVNGTNAGGWREPGELAENTEAENLHRQRRHCFWLLLLILLLLLLVVVVVVVW